MGGTWLTSANKILFPRDLGIGKADCWRESGIERGRRYKIMWVENSRVVSGYYPPCGLENRDIRSTKPQQSHGLSPTVPTRTWRLSCPGIVDHVLPVSEYFLLLFYLKCKLVPAIQKTPLLFTYPKEVPVNDEEIQLIQLPRETNSEVLKNSESVLWVTASLMG